MSVQETSSESEIQTALALICTAGDAACDTTPDDLFLSQLMIIATYTGTIADMLKQAQFDPNWEHDIRDALTTIQQAAAAAQRSLHRWKPSDTIQARSNSEQV